LVPLHADKPQKLGATSYGFSPSSRGKKCSKRHKDAWCAAVPAAQAALEPPQGCKDGLQVRLNVYDVSQKAIIRRLNSMLAHQRSPLKLGGVFHTGVEVCGLEWSFGRCEYGTGIRNVKPRAHKEHHFRQTLYLPSTQLPADAIVTIMEQLKLEYQGKTYDHLRRNCCHFADELCQRLGVGKIPNWVYRLARIGAQVNVDAVLRVSCWSPASESASIAPECRRLALSDEREGDSPERQRRSSSPHQWKPVWSPASESAESTSTSIEHEPPPSPRSLR
jgi:hypothetical protein